MSQQYVNEETTDTENLKKLQEQLEHFTWQYNMTLDRKTRYEQLMSRKSAKKWSPEKVARAVRRYTVAKKDYEDAEAAFDLVKYRLSQRGVTVDVAER